MDESALIFTIHNRPAAAQPLELGANKVSHQKLEIGMNNFSLCHHICFLQKL
jgi:hypothetical protein